MLKVGCAPKMQRYLKGTGKNAVSFYWGLTKLGICEYNIKATLDNFFLISETLHDLRNAF